MKLKIANVGPPRDGTRSGLINADVLGVGDSFVEYVSPYAHKDAAFIAMPPEGSQILVAEMEAHDDPSDGETVVAKYYYLGSIVGGVQGHENAVNLEKETVSLEGQLDVHKSSLAKHKEADENMLVADPGFTKGSNPDGAKRILPNRLNDMFDGKGGVPEKIGLVGENGSGFIISDQYEAAATGDAEGWQNYQIEMKSGSGKVVECVDSPKVKAIVMTPRPDKKDKLVFASDFTDSYSKSEFLVDTEGPIHMYTRGSQMDMFCRDGRNILIKNTSPCRDAEWSLTPGGNQDGGYPGQGSQTGGYGDLRDSGDEMYGCVQIVSEHNNISLSALEHDSVIRIHAPGTSSKVVITTGGTVDVIAERKITLTSNEAIEMNAPHVDINGGDRVDITAPNVLIDNNGERHLPDHNGSTQATWQMTESGQICTHTCEDC